MSQSSNLYRLQQIDSQIDQFHNRLNRIEAILNDNSALQAAQIRLKDADKQLEQSQRELRQAESQVEDHKVKIELNESALYGGKVRNPKELQDLQHEVISLKKYFTTLEDRQLDAMLAVEEAEKIQSEAKLNFYTIQGKVVEEQAHLVSEREKINQSLERFQVERQVAAAEIPADNMEIYIHLRKTRSGVAVAQINDHNCSACGYSLPPANIQAASSPANIERCPSCNRILYAG
jgi:predicted  nucleic acid-binding Zn-ribbon protein